MTPLLRRDPSTFVLGFATWAVLSGISLMAPGDPFTEGPVYAELARMGVADTWWGLGLIADGLLLGATVWLGGVGWRALVAILSAPLWFGYGCLVVIGGWGGELRPETGAFDMLSAIGLAMAGTQWAYTLAPTSPALVPSAGLAATSGATTNAAPNAGELWI